MSEPNFLSYQIFTNILLGYTYIVTFIYSYIYIYVSVLKKEAAGWTESRYVYSRKNFVAF